MSQPSFYRVVIAIILVCAVAASLWFASPVEDTATAANIQGLIHNERGEYHEAIAAFTRAIELDPTFALAYSNRGRAYIELEQYEEAIADYDKAIELDPSLKE